MSIFLRKKLTDNFTHLPNSLIRNPNLSWKATGFLAYLLSCADEWQLNFADLSKRKKDRESATRGAAMELKEAGYLQINKIRDEKGRIIAHEWVVSQAPEFQNPDVENPHLENQPQTINKSFKTNSKKQQQPPRAAGQSEPESKDVVVSLSEELQKRGVISSVAESLVKEFDFERVRENIAYVDKQLAAGKVGDLAAFLVKAIQNDYRPKLSPVEIENEKRKKEARERKEQEKRTAAVVEEKRKEEFKERNSLALSRFDELAADEKIALSEQFSGWLFGENPIMFKLFKDVGFDSPLTVSIWCEFLKHKLID